MYQNFGAVVDGSSVTFNVFFPDKAVDPAQYTRGDLPRIATLQVAGDFQMAAWDIASAPALTRQPHPNGWLYTCRLENMAEDFYQYKYFVTFENGTSRWCSDPCSKYGGSDQENSGFVIGGNSATVVPIAQRLPLEDLVIYELMIDDFTAEYRGNRAPLDAIWDKLDHLQALGVNAIEFMPWTTWPGGSFSWGYDPVAFFSVEYRYYHDPAAPLDKLFRLQQLINELHRRNIHVIMDGVFNHVRAGQSPDQGFAYYWFYQNPADSPYVGGFSEGGFFEEFDFDNLCTSEFITDACKYWLDEYCIDGIRFDYVKGIYDPRTPALGIKTVIDNLNRHTAAKGLNNVTFTLEFLTDNRYAAIELTNQIGATGCWYDQFMYESFGIGGSGHVYTSYVRGLNSGKDFGAGRFPVTYIENHDHSTLTEKCGGRTQWWRTQPLMIALFTICGAPMVHNGQEFGEQYWIPDSGSGRVEPRRLRWNNATDGTGRRLIDLYKQLIALRQNHPALRSANFYPEPYDMEQKQFNPQGYGVNELQDVAIYHRWGPDGQGRLERFIIALNFSAFDQPVHIPFSTNGTWQDLLSGHSVQVQDYWLYNQTLSSHWGRVYYQKA